MSEEPGSTMRLLVTPDREGDRLDVFLAATTNLSRRSARRHIADGLVLRNREVVRVQSRQVELGDVIDIQSAEDQLAAGPRRPPEIDSLFEDPWLIVAAKPAGVLSQPAEGQRPGEPLAFDQRVLLSLAWRDGKRPFLRLIHRLDRTTSGALLFARSPEALPALSRSWSSGRVDRLYLAIIEGRPTTASFVVERPIARDPNHRWRFECSDRGKPSRTEIEVVAALGGDLTVVACRLVTGRTHQVRVHLAASGHPVLGDRLYNSQRADLAARPLLHAAALALPHPTTDEPLQVICPPPIDVAEYLPDDLDLSRM